METSTARTEPMDPAELIQRARSLARSGTRRILGITGAPGSGKSTVARLLVEALGPDTAALVPMDGFHLANSLLKDLGRQQRKGAPDTFDDGGYAALLARLHGQSAKEPQIYAPDFRRELDESIGSALPVRATVPLVITEGNYLLLQEGHWPHARTVMDEVWYLEIDDAVRRERLIRRHAEFGRTPDEARAWALGSDEANARLIIGHAHRADIRIRLDARPA